MNWGFLIAQLAPSIISLLSNTSGALKTNEPIPAKTSALSISPVKASEAIKALQSLLNTALGLNPPLVEDGWLGPKTEAAIMTGVARLRSFGF